MEAFKLLKRESIEARIVHNMDEATRALRAEADENTCRKALEPIEAVAIGLAIEELVKPRAEERKQQSPDRPKKGRAICPKISKPQSEHLRTAAVAAAGVGMKRRTYEMAKAVVKSGNQEAIDMMATTGKVNPSYGLVAAKPKKPVSRSDRSLEKYAGLLRVSDALSFAAMAISQLERIRIDDPKREDAFVRVETWIQGQRRMK